MVNGLDDMAGVHKRMEGLGPVHHRNSVSANGHMPVFETVRGAPTHTLERARARAHTDEAPPPLERTHAHAPTPAHRHRAAGNTGREGGHERERRGGGGSEGGREGVRE